MMRAEKAGIPAGSLTEGFLPADYMDTFRCRAEGPSTPSPDDLLVAFWNDFPWWVSSLFAIRNFLVRFVGLKGSGEQDPGALERCIREGGEYGFVSVPAKNRNETVLLLRDKHLDAYISVHVGDTAPGSEVSATTLVHFNNRLGRVYFFFIKPFHGIIVKSQLRRILKKHASGKTQN